MTSTDDMLKFSNFFSKKIQNLNFHFHIWIQHEKYIQMSTNKPSIGSVVPETAIDVEKVLQDFILLFYTKTPAWKASLDRGSDAHTSTRTCLLTSIYPVIRLQNS